MKNTQRENTVNEILEEIRTRRNPSYTTKKVINLILTAMINYDYEPLFITSLYKSHGGEYSELLSVISNKIHIQLDEDGKKTLKF
jgi:hypothetical protein